MCSPAAAGVLMGGSTALQAYGQIREGQTANAVGIYNQQAANQNAGALKGQAKDAIVRGDLAGDKLRLDAARATGEGRASFAAGNVDLSSGSASYWELDQAQNTEADVGAAKYAAKQEAYGFRVAARNEIARGRLARFEGKERLHASYLGAAGTTLSGAGKLAGS